MKGFFVYLAGPITGCHYGECVDWRDSVKENLFSASGGRIEGLSPMRWKDELRTAGPILDTYEDNLLSSQRGITARDRFDCMRADLVLVNLLGAQRISIGTVMEIAWANSRDIPIVLVMEPEGNLHDHAMIREVCPLRVATLDEALMLIHQILLP